MLTFDQKEIRLLTKISHAITELELSLEKLEDTDHKLKHFYEQEKAIHEIRVIIKNAKKVERLVNEEIILTIDDVIYETAEELSLAQEIDQEFEKLEQTLSTIDDTDNKVKSYLEQQKALHEAKRILSNAQKLNRL
ncbi:hypothetical protein I6N95_08515 [Vagococcus sp. BWB3-3]|uniref:Uncharacterized protein n=1 Tax=Vagococcus allomyrinae TaxID=2794353 RepID=A0A940P3V3_9ENTE|nr:hypothetical protein [Vagococcus allomyrinae]MBP1041044.1 hypothetical protein [Vagococcus allomyrinae]